MRALKTIILLFLSITARPQTPMFDIVYPDESNIAFANDLFEDSVRNVIGYEYMYHGGGVAIGDINNDGLPDVYLTGNMLRDRLYLNEGVMRFKDITETAGIDLEYGWKFGVTMADVNGDGWLDIYVCRAGDFPPEMRTNRLYMNNGDGTFTDKAKLMGVADDGHSLHAAFLDYDHDGDLDLYVANTPRPVAQEITIPFWEPHVPQRCDVLYRNDGGKFVDATAQAKLPVIEYGYGLSVSVGDVNNDGWDDIYVANDYAGPDYMYMNNGDGTFTNQIYLYVGHISNNSMGSAISDLNNDGWPEICVVDMVAPDYRRSKRMMATMDVDNFWYIYEHGGHYQYMKNTLQLNNRNGSFSEIGQFAGISQTDWSWAVLPADLDNDGHKDLFITNGIFRDITDKDFEARSLALLGQLPDGTKPSPDEFLLMLESTELSNYAFRNNGDLTFSNKAKDWGLDLEGFSNGVAYGDLDLDGDLDLVINNVNFPAMVYRNHTRSNHVRVKLDGVGNNRLGVGARVEMFYAGGMQHAQQQTTQGWLSSCEPVIHFGLGTHTTVDSIHVTWVGGKVTRLITPQVNTVVTAKEIDARPWINVSEVIERPFEPVTMSAAYTFRHRENAYDDLEKEVLLPHKMSQMGPALCVADVNGDGLEDFYIGGAAGQAGELRIQSKTGEFTAQTQPWDAARAFEDVDAVFFDADDDGDPDLYVASGGNEFDVGSPLLQDRLYINDGLGNFERDLAALPEMLTSTGCVAVGDVNGDGRLDLFVGGRVLPRKYPYAPRSYILLNEGRTFTDATERIARDLMHIGMVTDATWADINADGTSDLVLCGEWMSIHTFINENGVLTDQPMSGLSDRSGWWWSLKVTDIDSDGDLDILAGNMGHNGKFHASEQKPFHVFSMDFDGNGTNDIVLSKYYNDQLVPVRGRQCSSTQMPFIAQKFPTYRSFSEAYLHDIFGTTMLEEALHLTVNEFGSGIFLNDGKGTFSFRELPHEAQWAPIMSIETADVNDDGRQDIITSGNFWPAEVETIRHDAGTGLVMLNLGPTGFEPMHLTQSGLYTARDVRRTAFIKTADGGSCLLVANNNDYLQMFRFRKVHGR